MMSSLAVLPPRNCPVFESQLLLKYYLYDIQISILYNNFESGVVNAGFMTKYFKVSRGVCQGCPLSPLSPPLFVLAVEIIPLKICQDQLCWGIELLNGQNAKISQFADDSTLILEDTTSLKNAMNIVNSFGVLSTL